MRIFDISIPLSENTPAWPGDPPVQLERAFDMRMGARYNLTRASLSVHAGTHVDAPLHFIEDGGSVDGIRMESLIGLVRVIAVPDADVIDRACLEGAGIPGDTGKVLFQTRNAQAWEPGSPAFCTDFVALDLSGAEWLVEREIHLVGIDYLSIARYGFEMEVHRELLEAGVVILEGLDLRGVLPGEYWLCCLPLNLAGIEAAPARAVLISEI
jgi:arylformamidase